MNRRNFIKRASGLLIPATFGIFVPKLIAQPRGFSPAELASRANRSSATGGAPIPDYAWYKFNNNANDSSGNSRNATLSGSPSYGTGPNGNADIVLVRSSSQYVNCSTIANFTTGARSFTCWLKRSADGSLLGVYSNELDATGYACLLNLASSLGRVSVRRNAGAGGTQHSNVSVIPEATWTFLAVVENTTTTKIYVNGSDVTGTPVTMSASASSSANFTIGLFQTSSYFDGEIDDFRIYTTELTTSEISAIYAAGAQ